VGKSAEAEKKERVDEKVHYTNVASLYYNFIMGCLLTSLIIVSVWFIVILRKC
jgi:hypothetical protein